MNEIGRGEGETQLAGSAVVLLSGGLDSATCLAWAARRYARVVALSFDYGQRHGAELAAAGRVAEALGVDRHVVVKTDLRQIGGSALTDDSIDVPKHAADGSSAARPGGIPVTYVPARNMLFLSVAVGLAEVEGAEGVVIGVNAVDYSGYPDCRPAFVEAFARAANLGTKRGVESADGDGILIETPIIGLTKREIIAMGVSLGVDYSMTVSCYDASADGLACGRCDSCVIRARAFREAGVVDPTRYAAEGGR